MKVGVGVACQGDAFDALSFGEDLSEADREEVEVRDPERCGDGQAEQCGDDGRGGEGGLPGAEADRDQRLAERDDDDQAMALDEVRGLEPPTLQFFEQGAEHADRQRRQPEQWSEVTGDECGDEDQDRAGHSRPSQPDHRGQEVGVAACGQGEEREVHEIHDQEGDAEEEAWLPNAFGTASAATNIAAIATSIAASTASSSGSIVFVSQA